MQIASCRFPGPAGGWGAIGIRWALALTLLLTLAAPAIARQQAVPPITMDVADLLSYDRDVPLDPSEKLLEETSGHRAFAVSYYSVNDQRVPAILVLPPVVKEGAKLPALLLMHGLGMNKTGLKLMWDQFARNGFAILAIDAQYHGDRKPKEPLEVFGKHVYASRDMLVQTVVDLRRGIDYLQSRKDIDPDRIGYAGFSMGGMLGSILAGVDTRVKAPVIALAGGDFHKLSAGSSLGVVKKARETGGRYNDDALRALDPLDPARWIGRIAPRPVLLINGDSDNVVPVECGRILQAAAREPKEIFMYKGGHVPLGNEMARVIVKITNWLNEHVKRG